MEHNDLFVEQMPFFEALYGKGKAKGHFNAALRHMGSIPA